MNDRIRCDELLGKARAIADTARRENRGLSTAEQDQVDSAISEVRGINDRAKAAQADAATAESKRIMGALDDMARGRYQHGDTKRLVFGEEMAKSAAERIMPSDSYGQKAVSPSGAAVVAQSFSGDPVQLGQPATSLLSVLPVTVQSSPQFSYLRQSVRTNLAAVVAEGAVKPTSVYSVVRVDDSLDVIAHLSEPLPRLWLADNAALQTFLNNELTYGLALAVEAKAIADVAATSGIQAQSYSTGVLQTLRKAVTRLEANGYPPSTIVLHPTDFETIELALLSVPAIEYGGLPAENVARRLWGLPVTTTVAATVGVGYVLANGAVGLNTDQQGVQIAWSETSNADDFSKNLIRARCEGRYATSVFQPMGVVSVDLTA